jgi:hypothetical protein
MTLSPDLSAQVMAELLLKRHGSTYAAAVALFDDDAPQMTRTEIEMRDRILSELLHLDARTLGITPIDRSAA